MKWIIDDTMKNPKYGGSFYDTLISMGREVVEYDFSSYRTSYPMYADEATLCYGSIDFVRTACKVNNVMAFAPTSIYDYSYIVSTFDSRLLVSDDAMFIPYFYLYTHSKMLERIFGKRIFIRTNSGNKVLSGQVVDLSRLDILTSIGRGCNPETMLVVSSEKSILEEYRVFLTAKNGAISASTYNHDGLPTESISTSHEACRLAEKAFRNIQDGRYDELIVIDVALLDNGEYRVIECNAPSTSGLYSCDAKPIIEAMEKIIYKEISE